MKTYHFVYKTINLVNSKYYYGKHSTDDITNDNYLGSGKLLKRSIKKYGRSSFHREIIQFTDTQKHAYELEAKIVTETLVNDPMCYNVVVGGDGGFCGKDHPMYGRTGEDNPLYGRTGEKSPLYGRKLTVEHKRKISEQNNGEKNPCYGRTGEKNPNYGRTGEKHPMYGKHHSQEAKQKISDTHSGVPKKRVTCPHCGKVGGKPIMYRYHFDKCKHKTEQH